MGVRARLRREATPQAGRALSIGTSAAIERRMPKRLGERRTPIGRLAAFGLAGLTLTLSACAATKPAVVTTPTTPPTATSTAPSTTTPTTTRPSTPSTTSPSRYLSAQTGYATFLASSFHGNESASGEVFDSNKLVAAHRTLPFGSIVRVTNLQNGRSVNVRIIDRGPYGKNYREGTIIDLSRAAARRVRMIQDGQVRVRVTVIRLGAEG